MSWGLGDYLAEKLQMKELQIRGLKTGVLCDANEHARADFLAVMEGKYEVRPAVTDERSMRAGLSFDLPADTEKGS